MRELVARQVHRFFGYGLELKEKLDAGQRVDRAKVLNDLQALILNVGELNSEPDWAGDDATNHYAGGQQPLFLGVRYPLVCWLDELMIMYPRSSWPTVPPDEYDHQPRLWTVKWNENSLEAALYGNKERAWRFWEQAQLAANRPGSGDVLEVFFWAVMLGFRGDMRESPDALKNWVEATQRVIVQSQQSNKMQLPPENQVETNVPPLTGRKSFHNAMRLWIGLLLVAFPVLLFILTVGKVR